MTASDESSSAVTLRTYELHSALYIAQTAAGRSPLVDDLIALVPGGSSVLELGSGPGRDALALEAAGLAVSRTDGATAFVTRFVQQGLEARTLNVNTDDFGGPYDAIFANAVLLHVPRSNLARVLQVARRATRPGGILAATFKKGTSAEWSERKLASPRFFTYWMEGELREVVSEAGWIPLVIAESTQPGSAERWITLTARHAVE